MGAGNATILYKSNRYGVLHCWRQDQRSAGSAEALLVAGALATYCKRDLTIERLGDLKFVKP